MLSRKDRLLNLLVLVFAALAASPAFAGSSNLMKSKIEVPSLSAKLSDFKSKMIRAPRLTDKLKVFDELKKYIQAELGKITPDNIDQGDNNSRELMLDGLGEYLDLLQGDFSQPETCEARKRRIYASARDGLPNVAKEALDILAILCGKPALAD